MSYGDILAIFKDAIITAMTMAAPFLIVSVAIGIIISVFQAATQIHEQNIIFVPKIVATALMLIMLASWLINMMIGFTQRLFANISLFM